MKKLISVIIVTRNRPEQVIKAITSVKETNINQELIEIIVADNNDDDLTSSLINSVFSDVICLKMGGNKGVTIPRNLAAKKSKGEYLYFMDDDAWVDKNVFSLPLIVLKNTPHIFAVMSKTFFIRENGIIPPKEKAYNLHLFLTLFENCFLIRKDVFLQIGGFNELIFYGSEGEDLSLRAFYRGYYCVRCMDSIAYHPSSSTKTPNADLVEANLIARCISAKTSWPVISATTRIIKTAVIDSIKEAKLLQSTLVWRNIFTGCMRVLFFRIEKDKKIKKILFRKFRKLRLMNIKIEYGCDYNYVINSLKLQYTEKFKNKR